MYFVVYRDTANYWRWTLYAGNNRKVANSGEGYNNKSDAVNAIALVSSVGGGTPIHYM